MRAADLQPGDVYNDPQSGDEVWRVDGIVERTADQIVVRLAGPDRDFELTWHPDDELEVYRREPEREDVDE